jgi:hypothetical protein
MNSAYLLAWLCLALVVVLQIVWLFIISAPLRRRWMLQLKQAWREFTTRPCQEGTSWLEMKEFDIRANIAADLRILFWLQERRKMVELTPSEFNQSTNITADLQLVLR